VVIVVRPVRPLHPSLDPGAGGVSILGCGLHQPKREHRYVDGQGKMVFTVLGAVAELERNIIRERVSAGLRRAKKEGKTLGRPRVIVDRDKVRLLHGQGNSVRMIAAQLGLTKSTVHSMVVA
jgi:DNA invertase Pin-like site-specific DNA recombinase